MLDLKYEARAPLTNECRVSYGEPYLKLANWICDTICLSASRTAPRLIHTILQKKSNDTVNLIYIESNKLNVPAHFWTSELYISRDVPSYQLFIIFSHRFGLLQQHPHLILQEEFYKYRKIKTLFSTLQTMENVRHVNLLLVELFWMKMALVWGLHYNFRTRI